MDEFIKQDSVEAYSKLLGGGGDSISVSKYD